MACEFWDLGCKAKEGAGEVISGIADDAIANLAKAIMEGMSQMVTTLSTFWVSMPTVNLTSQDGSTASPVVSALNSELMPWTLALAVLAVILGGIRLIWEQRGAPLKDLLRSLLTLTLVTGLGLGVISILVIAADALSAELINRSTSGKGFADSMQLLVMTNQTGVGVFILIVLGLIGLLASLVQIVLMVVRSGMLVILAGILPTTASFTNTEMGKQWFQKAVGWTIAFIAYKPAAAIVYSVAFLLMGRRGQDALISSITGFTLMVVALFALPALMRFVTPLVAAVASGGGGAGAGAVVGAIATGAVSLGRGGSGRGNASPTPASSTSTTSTQMGSSPKGSDGTPGPRGRGGQPTPGATGPSGAAGMDAAGKAGMAGAGSAGATAGAGDGASAAGRGAAAAGPAGVAVATGARVASATSQVIEKTAQDSTGEGPSGSN
ncbi:hypothetical protein ACIPY2_19975 [Paenarthrobacter sp. NPDC089675]|uniref:hypothetical protein n=1 Tax=Paenarthrobacter TaxID=1742992 RepID=UPI00382085F7